MTAVNVTSTERISQDEKDFCEKEQRYGEFAITMKNKLLELANEITTTEKEFCVEDDFDRRISYFDDYHS